MICRSLSLLALSDISDDDPLMNIGSGPAPWEREKIFFGSSISSSLYFNAIGARMVKKKRIEFKQRKCRTRTASAGANAMRKKLLLNLFKKKH